MNYCMGCMKMIPPGVEVCPLCGYDQRKNPASNLVLPQGSILHNGKFLVGRMLGQGGFGITYIGLDLTLDLTVAIKEYFPMGSVTRQLSTSQVLWSSHLVSQKKDGCNSFLREARKMAKVNSIANIVAVREFFEENETAYIVMNYVEGVTLTNRLINGGRMSFRECASFFHPLIESLGEAHSKGLIHRDIKPDNIMIDKVGKVWLLDFGAAREVDALHSDGGIPAGANGYMPIAPTGLVVSRGFSPPEQYIDSSMVGPWTDVYALVATIYYCLTGKLVPDALARQQGQGALQFPDTLKKEEIAVLQKGLALKTTDRYQSMQELGRALAQEIPYRPELSHSDSIFTKFAIWARTPGKGIQKAAFLVIAFIVIILINDMVSDRIEADKNTESETTAVQTKAHTDDNETDTHSTAVNKISSTEDTASSEESTQTETTDPDSVNKGIQGVSVGESGVAQSGSALEIQDDDVGGNPDLKDYGMDELISMAEGGDTDASYELGERYAGLTEETYVSEDYQEAYKWYQKAAEKGNAEAEYKLGALLDYYIEGGDKAKALEWYESAAQKGQLDAMNTMGMIYLERYEEFGVTRNYKRAFTWFKKAAESGSVDAQYNLGYMYQNGYGTGTSAPDYDKAFEYYKMVADQGEALGELMVGYAYYTGNCPEGKENYEKAWEWFEKAAEQDESNSMDLLGYMAEQGMGIDAPDYELAKYWYERAVELDNIVAMYDLGHFYEEGHDTGTPDYVKAYEWYKKAEENGNEDATEALNKDVFKGMGG